MLVGHYAPALLVRGLTPAVPLWQLFVAAQLLDFAWAALLVAGLEHDRLVPGFTASNDLDLFDMPWSHSLVAALLWSCLAGAVWAALRRGPAGRLGGACVALVVLSHWLLDLVVHAPDLPLAAGDGPRVGLGLWRLPWLSALLELALVAATGAFMVRKLGRGAGLVVGLLALGAASYVTPTPATLSELTLTLLAVYCGVALAGWRAVRTHPDR